MAKSIAILGSGISGLSTAYYLIEKSIQNGVRIGKIYLLEQQSRVGGWLQSKPIPNTDGEHFELGPRTISLNSYAGINVLSLVNSIGLADQVRWVSKHSKSFKRRYVVIDGQLRLLPSSLSDLFIRRPPFKPFFYYLLNDLRQPPVKIDDPITDDISVDNFFRQRFGEDIARYLINPLCMGITGGDSRSLSMRSIFASLFQKEQTYGSIVKSMFKKEDIFRDLRHDHLVSRSIDEKWAVFSFRQGIETLPKRLSSLLAENYPTQVELILDTKVEGIEFPSSDKCVINVVHKQRGSVADKIKVDHCFSSIPAIHLGSLIEKDQLKSTLLSIKTVHMAVVCMKFDSEIIPSDMGFGFLVPASENSNILGVTFDSCIFPERQTKLTVMLGGYMFEKLFGHPDQVDHQRIIDISRQALKTYMKIDDEPSQVHVAIHSDCIPQYTVGHQRRLRKIEQEIQNLPLSLLGASYYGFSVPDTILNAKREAMNWLRHQI
ncbi:protoporphyrinogen oxidase-like protein [Euroglyphus maynei]|uniref:Protoporphyrinogen oxidase n=1 Tax=Euroglyphus maynei TaxID=6958 RepID=A0A1Y3BHC1_EURMA|nr:protoporphyrinogen oxidase-like protein [Euroglyphus maynei]